MGLLNELNSMGLITESEARLGEGLQRSKERIIRRHIPATSATYTDAAQETMSESLSYLDKQIQKQNALNAETGVLSYGNLTNSNPLVSVGANALNFGANVAGATADQFSNLMGGINVSNANALYAGIPADIKDIYDREQLDLSRNDNAAALNGIRNALAQGDASSLIGYDKKFKTRTQLDEYMRDLENKVNSKPVTEEERAKLDSPDGRVMRENSLLTPLRQSYRDVFNQINQNYEDDRMWRGDRAKGVDNFFGSRSWGNDRAMESFTGDFQQRDQANAELNKQGAFQRANADFGSEEYWEGVGKSWDAFKGSVGSAAGALRDNPMAAVDILAETAPFLIGRTANVAMSGDAQRIYADGSQAVREREGTAGVNALQSAGIAAGAAAYTGLNLAERNVLLGAIGGRNPVGGLTEGVRSAASRVGQKAVDAMPAYAARTAEALGTAGSVAGGILSRAAVSGALEGAVEMGQTQIEDSWSRLENTLNTSNLAQAGVMGAALGAGMSAPGSVKEMAVNRIQQQGMDQAEELYGDTQTDEVEDLTNPANPNYNPLQALNRVLAEDVANGDYESAKGKADSIVNSTISSIKAMEAREAYIDNTDALKDRIDAGNAVLQKFMDENTAETNPNYDRIVDLYGKQIGGLQTMYDELTSPEFDAQGERNMLERMREGLTQMEEPYKKLNDAYAQQQARASAAAASQPEQDTQPPANETTEDEARRHLGAPTASNLGRINELLADETVSEPVRAGLRVVADALLKANAAKDIPTVRGQVTKGDIGFRGTEQYIDEMAKAIKSGDTGRMESLDNQLRHFATSRQGKLDAIGRAQQLADETGKQVQVVKPAKSNWEAVEGKPVSPGEFRRNNGILVNPHRADGSMGADSLMEAISGELDIIMSTAQALRAMRSIPADTANSQANALRDEQMTERNSTSPAVDPAQQAIDDMNRIEREVGRDMSFRDNDPNARTINQEEAAADVLPSTEGNEGSNAGSFDQAMQDYEDSLQSEQYEDFSDYAGSGTPAVEAAPVKQEAKPAAKPTKKAEPAKPEPKKEKFNYRRKFTDKKEAADYIAKHGKAADYFAVNDDQGNITLQRKPAAEAQPAASAEAAMQTANEQHTIPASVEATEPPVSEASTESNMVQPDTRNDSITEYEAGTEQEATKDASPEGAMSVLDTEGRSNKEVMAEERAKDWREQNLIKSGFIQVIRDGRNSPLVMVKDFIQTIPARSRKAISDMVTEFTGKQASEEQVLLVNDYMQFAKARGVNRTIQSIVKANTNPAYNYKYFSDFLLNEEGKIDDNVASAISLAIYSWVGENATSLYADKAAMGKILGIKNVEDIPPAVADRIINVGMHQKTLAASMGQRIYQSLQMKMVKDVDPSRQSKVEQMFGTLAIGVMIDMGLADRTRMRTGELYALSQFTEGKIDDVNPQLWTRKPAKSVDMDRMNSKAATYFIRPAAVYDNNGRIQPTNFNKAILDKHKGTKGILSEIFSFNPYVALPSLEPVTELPATFNDFQGELPSKVKEALLKQQSLGYKLNVPMVEMVNRLASTNSGNEAIGRIMGYTDPATRHKAFEKSVISVNQGIERSLNIMADTYDLVGDNPFYLTSTIWSNMRNGNLAGFNPQGDKIHRGFVSLANDKITVPTDQAAFDENGSLTDYGMFLRGLAFRMEDVKINKNAVDKTLVAEFIPQFEAYINSPEVRRAADALNRMLNDTYTEHDLTIVGDLLSGWEMGSMGLSALMAINEFNQAKDMGAVAVDIYMAADSDGLVNGPSITNIMMFTGSPEFYKSVGIIPFAQEGEEQLTSMQQFRKTPNALDPYEQLAVLQNKYWEMLKDEYSKPANKNSPADFAIRSLDFLDNAYGERSGAKRALTPFNYGSGMDSVNRANARGTLDAIYKAVEKAGRVYQENPTQMHNTALAINQLIRFYNLSRNTKVPLVETAKLADMNELLSPAQEAAIRGTDILLRGNATTHALNELMVDYIQARNVKTSMANTAFTLFDAIFSSKKEALIEKNIAEGKALETASELVEGLTAKDMQQLMKDAYAYMPVLATPMGIASKAGAKSGIPLANMGKHWNPDKTIEVKFNASFGHIFTPESSALPSGKQDKKNDSTTLKTDIREKSLEAPGVGSLALFIQSHDAYVTYQVMLAMEAQNFHDANSTNAYDLAKMAVVQNKAFLDATTTSHIGKAFTDAMSTVLKEFVAADIPAYKRTDPLLALTAMVKKAGYEGMTFKEALPLIYADNYKSDIDKLIFMSQQYSISQYATEGGSYVLTAQDRAKIIKTKDDLIKTRDAALREAAVRGAQLDEMVRTGEAAKPVPEAEPSAEEAIEQRIEETVPAKSSFQQSLADNKAELTDPVKLIKHVKANLSQYLKQEGNKGKYASMYNELLTMAQLAMPANMTVNIIDSSTDTSKVIGYDKSLADGTTAWYASEGGRNQINLRMDKDSINSTVIVHEFMHAATANAIAALQANPSAYPKGKETLDKLNRLLDHVKTKVNSSHSPVIQYGVTNIDEFIATGLTYPEFMDFLDTITDIPKEARSMSRIGTAFRTLVSNVLDALYMVAGKGRKYSAKTLSAYEALLLDTAELVTRTKDTAQHSLHLGAPREQAVNAVREFTAKEVYESLDDGSLDPDFKKKLGDVITNVTDKLFTALPSKFARGKSEYSPEQIWDEALKSGRAPYTTGALTAGFKLSAQEQFGIEALEVAIAEATKSGSVSTAYRAVARGFKEARAVITVQDMHPGNWNDASAEERAIAQSKHDYVFKVGQADYLSRFTALALASQEFNSMLTMKLKHDLFAERGQPHFDKLISMANRLVNYATERMTRTIGSRTVQGKLPMLAQLLVEIDLKNRNKSVNMLEDVYTRADRMANNAVMGLRDKANAALANSPARMFNNKYMRIVSNTLEATRGGRSAISVMDAIRDLRNHENPNQRLGFLGELANEVGEQNKDQIIGEKLLAYAKQNENMAQRIRSVVRDDILSQFAKDGADLTREDRAAVTKALLRTDVQSLLRSYSFEQVGKFISSRSILNNEIAKLEKQIADPVKISRTKSLGWYMVSETGTETLAKNPAAIAQGIGMGITLPLNQSETETIDKLASLYAIKYTDKKQLDKAHAIMEAEAKRGKDKDGAYALVKYHEALATEAYTTLFGDNPLSYIKGYMPNIMNPHKEVVVASTDADKARLKAAMYVEIGNVKRSALDPVSQGATLYYAEDAGNQRYVSGAMALYNDARKGTEINMTPQELADAINKARASIDTSPEFDPRKNSGGGAIPAYDTEGRIIAYNYEMGSHVRDTYMERNNDFSEVIGEFTAAGFNKVTLEEQNIAVADALIDQFGKGYKHDRNAYIYVGAGVSDSTLSQSWALIPEAVRKHIYNRTGQNGIYVHNQVYLTIFGSKKYSVTEAFDKHVVNQNVAEQLFTGVMRGLFRDSARIKTARTERIWQESVKLLKDFVVIRNVSTALVNIISNSFLLLAHGVNPKNVVKHSIEAVKAGTEYRKNMSELIKLQNRQRIDVTNAEEIQSQINMLQQRISRNPLLGVIESGLFSGVVEDIDADTEGYTYASGMQRKYEKVLNRVPKTVRKGASHLFVQPGTPLYQFLHSATQFGDFSAKYALYKHYTENAESRMSHDRAITMANNNFINYDVPTSKGMQYANDMGLLMFTKYNLRIQRALFNLMAKRPASAIGQAIVINALTNLPPGIDPLVFNQIGNPLRNGPLGLLGAWDEPFPIQLLF